jgi:Calcineurin-like phosphoesterase
VDEVATISEADRRGGAPDPWYHAPTLERPGTLTTRIAGPASLRPAGWSDTPRLAVGAGPFQALRWSNLRTNWAARDQVIKARLKCDLAGAMRNAWLDDGGRRQALLPPLLVAVRRENAPSRVLILGDTGDGSEAQFAVARHVDGRSSRCGVGLGAHAVDAMLIQSDIVYPAGSADEYGDKFFAAYAPLLERGIPIYAVPGNHDWNDGSLMGFMAAFCGATTRPAAVDAARGEVAGARGRHLLSAGWHDGSDHEVPPFPARPAGGAPLQPGPYVALDVAGVLFIGVDTGYDGPIDHEQATWLVEVVEAAPGVPKILFTGKPLLVDGIRQPCEFLPPRGSSDGAVHGASGFAYTSVDDVVGRAANGFVAAVGGDIHNYQRYLVHIDDGPSSRTIPYLVAGGGGVFVGQTFWLPKVEIDGPGAGNARVRCSESDTVLFPQRAHSRLFVDAIMRKSLRRVRFTLFLALAIAGAVAIALWLFAELFSGHLGLGGLSSIGVHPGVGIALIAMAVAVNASAHPIAASGRTFVAASALVGCAAAGVGVERGIGIGGHTIAVAWSRGVIALLFVLGTALLLTPGPEHRLRGRVGGVLVAAGAIASLDSGLPAGTQALWPIAGILILIAAVLGVASRWAFRRIPVERAFGDVADAIGSTPSPWLRVRLAAAGWLAKRQRLLSSLCETFSEGRLSEQSRLPGQAGTPFVPLYRSFLEIEYERVTGGDGWRFTFTAFAVTGEATSDTTHPAAPPVIADAFDVLWEPTGRTTVSPPPDPAAT